MNPDSITFNLENNSTRLDLIFIYNVDREAGALAAENSLKFNNHTKLKIVINHDPRIANFEFSESETNNIVKFDNVRYDMNKFDALRDRLIDVTSCSLIFNKIEIVNNRRTLTTITYSKGDSSNIQLISGIQSFVVSINPI